MGKAAFRAAFGGSSGRGSQFLIYAEYTKVLSKIALLASQNHFRIWPEQVNVVFCGFLGLPMASSDFR